MRVLSPIALSTLSGMQRDVQVRIAWTHGQRDEGEGSAENCGVTDLAATAADEDF